MRKLFIGLCFVALISAVGCTSHSWTQEERYYQASYSEVFEKVPVVCKKCQMSLKKSDPEAGLMILNCHRIGDKLLTASLINMFAGDEVIVKVHRVEPMVTKVWVDSKARGQIGPDFGRTDRNVKALIKVLDKTWPIVEVNEEKGEKRPGANTSELPPASKED